MTDKQSHTMHSSERDFQQQVIDLLHYRDFKVAHFRPGMTSRTYINKKGKKSNVWVTPVQADGKGFPDIVAIREAHGWIAKAVAWELKTGTNKATPEQEDWLRLFSALGFHTGVYYPENLDEIVEVLEGWAMPLEGCQVVRGVEDMTIIEISGTVEDSVRAVEGSA